MKRVLILTPTYNEKENIVKLIAKIHQVNKDVDILVIDDNSPDGTGECVERIAAKDERVKALHREGKLGLGSAYVAGFRYAIKNKYDLIFQMDADLSHDPKYIPKLIKKSEKYDLVLGSRWVKGGGVEGWPFYRYIMSWGANLIARVLLSLKPRDITTGYRCYRREVLEKIDLSSIVASGYAFLEELIFRVQGAGFTISEVPIIFIDRRVGQTKMGLKEITTSSKAILKLFARRKGVGQIVKFGLIGLSGALVDFGILNLLVLGLKFNVYLSAAFSFVAAATNNFYWNKRWTFKGEATDKKTHLQFIQYMIITTIGFFINLLILRIFLPYFGRLFELNINTPLVLNTSKIIATLVVMTWNFLGSKKWVFKSDKVE